MFRKLSDTSRPLVNNLMLGRKRHCTSAPWVFLYGRLAYADPVTFVPENSCLLFPRLPKNNLQKSPHQFQVTLDNCLEGTHIWKKNIQMESNWKANPLTLHMVV
jgi:hypothetical protein